MCLLVFLFASMAWSQPAGSSGTLRAAHEALFASFLPNEELQRDPRLAPLASAVDDGIWSAFAGAPFFQRLLQPFADLRLFGDSCGISSYRKSAGSDVFAAMTPPVRHRVLFLLETCGDNELRRLVMTLRNLYITRAYGALQEPLAGVRLNLYAPDSYIAQHRPPLPRTRLRYDRDRNEVVSEDGVFDYVIAGSGPAGSVLAHELRRGGKRVVLVERGSFVVPGSMETRLVGDLIETRTSVDGAILISNGAAVGGGSLVNVDLGFAPTLPSVQARIAGWRREGRIAKTDFTPKQLAAAYEWVQAAIGTRKLSESEINPNNRVLWDGARRAGLHPKLYQLNTYAPGRSPYPVTDKRSAESELLVEALEDPQNPLNLIPDAEVRRVLFEHAGSAKKAVGVEIRSRAPFALAGVIADPNGFAFAAGETFTIRARAVILSAGALGSPAILLRSGLTNGQIGRGVILHPSIPILGKFDRVIDALSGTQASVFVDDSLLKDGYAMESMSAPPSYAALMSPGPPEHALAMVKSFRNLAGFGVMLIDTPSSENRITLDSEGEPLIQYTLSEADKQRFRRGVAQAVRVMFQAGAKQVFLPTTEDILGDPPAILNDIGQAQLVRTRLRFIPNRTILTSAHMQATDKMGSAPENSVVSRDFRVWDTEGLYVVDGSVFPGSIGANPMQSIYTFAKIFADRMTAPR